MGLALVQPTDARCQEQPLYVCFRGVGLAEGGLELGAQVSHGAMRFTIVRGWSNAPVAPQKVMTGADIGAI